MYDRDAYQTNPAPGAARAGTGRLPTGLPMPIAPTARPAASAVASTRALADEVAPAFAVLGAACRAAALPVAPGAPPAPTAPSPQSTAALAYLPVAFAERPSLAAQVLAAVNRYTRTLAALQSAEDALAVQALQPAMAESLRQEVAFLLGLARAFQDEPMLCRLFPAPRTLQELGVKPPAPAPAPAVPAPSAEEDAVLRRKAQALVGDLAPKMAIARAALAIAEGQRGAASFSPAARTARLVSLRLQGQAALSAELREGAALFEALSERLARIPPATAELIKAVVVPLSRLALDWSRHPLLRDVFPLTTPEAWAP